jgi:hypothetical protein
MKYAKPTDYDEVSSDGPVCECRWRCIRSCGLPEHDVHLMREVDSLYFSPKHEEFKPRTVYSMQNAFTSAFQQLDPIPMYRATTSAGEYFAVCN